MIAKWGEYLGEPECPYLRRWFVALPSGRSLRLHHFYRSDDTRYLHDHPWWYVTLVLRRGYADTRDAMGGGRESRWLRPGTIHFRRPGDAHCVEPGPKGSWTLVLTGAKTRKWGFYVDGNFVGVRKFFRDIGHPPCPAEDDAEAFAHYDDPANREPAPGEPSRRPSSLEDDLGKNRRP